jgi:hypothetical protein
MTYDLKGVSGQLVLLAMAVFHYALEQKHTWLIQHSGSKAVRPSRARHDMNALWSRCVTIC